MFAVFFGIVGLLFNPKKAIINVGLITPGSGERYANRVDSGPRHSPEGFNKSGLVIFSFNKNKETHSTAVSVDSLYPTPATTTTK